MSAFLCGAGPHTNTCAPMRMYAHAHAHTQMYSPSVGNSVKMCITIKHSSIFHSVGDHAFNLNFVWYVRYIKYQVCAHQRFIYRTASIRENAFGVDQKEIEKIRKSN